uniref:Uncharacterized protein n=1 Tax=Cacopsylla melanoneura TaxID=428564 RepID=A0A8D8Q956_9HEMI
MILSFFNSISTSFFLFTLGFESQSLSTPISGNCNISSVQTPDALASLCTTSSCSLSLSVSSSHLDKSWSLLEISTGSMSASNELLLAGVSVLASILPSTCNNLLPSIGALACFSQVISVFSALSVPYL